MSMLPQLQLPLNLPEIKEGDPYLHIRINAEQRVLIPFAYIQEVVMVTNDQITPIPNLPPHRLGLINQRSRIFWLIDLPIFLGFTPPQPPPVRFPIVILRHHNQALGIRVESIEPITRLETVQIQDISLDLPLSLGEMCQQEAFTNNQTIPILSIPILLNTITMNEV